MSSFLPEIGNGVKAVHDERKAEFEKQDTRITKVTQDFESVFIGMMLKQMRKSMAGDDPIFGKSSEAKVYQDMMDDKLASAMSKTGTFGLATAMKKSIERNLPPDPDAPVAGKLKKLKG
jgi:Rod binding domain-containing protein